MTRGAPPADIRDFLSYDPATGVFRWIAKPKGRGHSFKVGDVAGCVNPTGYREIRFQRVSYLAHRLAWWFVHGVWPERDIDHRNWTPGDDWIDNLRPATRSQNNANAAVHRDNKSGFKGVFFYKRAGKWDAKIKSDGRSIYLGRFDAPDAAARAYDAAAVQHFGEFARLNFSAG